MKQLVRHTVEMQQYRWPVTEFWTHSFRPFRGIVGQRSGNQRRIASIEVNAALSTNKISVTSSKLPTSKYLHISNTYLTTYSITLWKIKTSSLSHTHTAATIKLLWSRNKSYIRNLTQITLQKHRPAIRWNNKTRFQRAFLWSASIHPLNEVDKSGMDFKWVLKIFQTQSKHCLSISRSAVQFWYRVQRMGLCSVSNSVGGTMCSVMRYASGNGTHITEALNDHGSLPYDPFIVITYSALLPPESYAPCGLTFIDVRLWDAPFMATGSDSAVRRAR